MLNNDSDFITYFCDQRQMPSKHSHWHGASVDEEFIQIAITGRQSGPTAWIRPVTEEEYSGIK